MPFLGNLFVWWNSVGIILMVPMVYYTYTSISGSSTPTISGGRALEKVRETLIIKTLELDVIDDILGYRITVPNNHMHRQVL